MAVCMFVSVCHSVSKTFHEPVDTFSWNSQTNYHEPLDTSEWNLFAAHLKVINILILFNSRLSVLFVTFTSHSNLTIFYMVYGVFCVLPFKTFPSLQVCGENGAHPVHDQTLIKCGTKKNRLQKNWGPSLTPCHSKLDQNRWTSGFQPTFQYCPKMSKLDIWIRGGNL